MSVLHRLASSLARVSARSLGGRLLRAPLRLLPSGLRVPVLSGPLRGMRWIVGASTHGCWLGTYEPELQAALTEAISPGDVVYDIGANVGYYTLLASVCAGPTGRVYAFEPLPRNLELLERHLELNGCANVTVIRAAVGETAGTVRLSSPGHPATARVTADGDLEVDCLAIDQLIEQGTVPPPQVIKIDVEGSEGAVLRGAREMLTERRPNVFLSTHGNTARSECTRLLQCLGYTLRALESPDAEDPGDLMAVAGPLASEQAR